MKYMQKSLYDSTLESVTVIVVYTNFDISM